MTDNEQKPFDVRIKVHDIYLIILWDTNYFPGHEETKRICGVRVADSLFSIEAFASNSKPEYAVAQALAEKVRPALSDNLKLVEDEMKVSLGELTKELDDPLITAMDVVVPTQTEYPLIIKEGKGTPLVNAFVRLFVIADLIVASLKELHFKGAISKKDYKKREDRYVKPLRKLMHDLNQTIKLYHEQRKALTSK
ncbi:hypothetical protein [Pseudomonas syringae group genomosp. 3]|uniref:DUF1845 domain-containing protein n=1 Tax=Pseudomonas syringae pv. coriandricola TaxID=264453 RepID=A0A3M3JMQ8_9PSED|nr:hypothetical protein [Pseudomonas syringae group genomosp. 3]RMN12102.1 hypothetical protein ALQ65_200037 [Pseudomonas syringae pv. coriandricola]